MNDSATSLDDAALAELVAAAKQRRVAEFLEIIERESARLRCTLVCAVTVTSDGRLEGVPRVFALN